MAGTGAGREAIRGLITIIAALGAKIRIENQIRVFQAAFSELIESGADVEDLVLDLVHAVLKDASDDLSLNERVALLENTGIVFQIGQGDFNKVYRILGTGKILRVGNISLGQFDPARDDRIPGEFNLAIQAGLIGIGPAIDEERSVIIQMSDGRLRQNRVIADYGAVIMDAVSGPTWEAYALFGDRPSQQDLELKIQQLAQMLAEFHARYGLHGDVKGQNAFVTDEGILLIDFAFNQPLAGNQDLVNAELSRTWTTMLQPLLRSYQPPLERAMGLFNLFKEAYLAKLSDLKNQGVITDAAFNQHRDIINPAFDFVAARITRLLSAGQSSLAA